MLPNAIATFKGTMTVHQVNTVVIDLPIPRKYLELQMSTHIFISGGVGFKLYVFRI